MLFAWGFESSRCHHSLFAAVSQILYKCSVMSIYSLQVSVHVCTTHCQYSVTQMCTGEEAYKQNERHFLCDIMSQSELTTKSRQKIWHKTLNMHSSDIYIHLTCDPSDKNSDNITCTIIQLW